MTKNLLRAKELREKGDIHRQILIALMILTQIPIQLAVILILTLLQAQVHPVTTDARGERELLKRIKMEMEKEEKRSIEGSNAEIIAISQDQNQNGSTLLTKMFPIFFSYGVFWIDIFIAMFGFILLIGFQLVQVIQAVEIVTVAILMLKNLAANILIDPIKSHRLLIYLPKFLVSAAT